MELYHGDCLEIMAQLEPESVDALITDPPYFLPARHYGTARSRWPRSLSDLTLLETFYRQWFAAVDRVMKQSGVLYMFCDGQSYPVFYALAYPYVHKQRPIIWDKQTAINGYTWRHQHELILFAERAEAAVHKTGNGDVLKHRAVPAGSRVHPAEKPVPLIVSLIKASLPNGGVVFDPFMGSGSTGVAAQQAGCDFIGIEHEERYFQISRERLGLDKEPVSGPRGYTEEEASLCLFRDV